MSSLLDVLHSAAHRQRSKLRVEITCGHRSISVHLIGMTDRKYKWSDYMTAHITSCRPVVELTLSAHAQASYASCFVFMSAFNTRLSARVVCGLWVLESVSIRQLSIFRYAEVT